MACIKNEASAVKFGFEKYGYDINKSTNRHSECDVHIKNSPEGKSRRCYI